MLNPKFIDELTRKIVDTLPEGIAQLQNDIRKNIRAAVSSAFERMDLVTRQEFDVQAGVLARTREKLSALEAKVAALEQDAASGQPKNRGKASPKRES
ncbi:MAG: accessory factor UbiK family protein [Gammaproteobacteria bacterium]|jgi:ubiquinone biosynthesis accessory factor UbiK